MSFNKFLDPKNDFAFKHVFGAEKNKDILIHFINDMLGLTGKEKVQKVTFLKPNQDPEVEAAKQSLLDVLCEDQSGQQVIVEMQVAKIAGFEKRAQYYAAKAYGSQLIRGDRYKKLNKVIFIAITNFVMFPDKKAYQSNHVILDKLTHEHNLKDFSFSFLELPKFKKNIDELETMIEKWAYFFKHAEDTHEDDLKKIAGSDSVIEEAYRALNRYSWNPDELGVYERIEKHSHDVVERIDTAREDGHKVGKVEGKTEGLAEGKAVEKKRTALSLLSLGLSVKKIVQVTDLTPEEIQKFKA